jgi:hypothetical protein
MGYLDDLNEYEREHPSEAKTFAKKFALVKPEKPDKLSEYRDQRLNHSGGIGSYEPEFT